MSKILDTYWYSCLAGLIGIVKCEDEITKEIKYYIGIAYGANEEADARYIQKNGSRLYPKILLMEEWDKLKTENEELEEEVQRMKYLGNKGILEEMTKKNCYLQLLKDIKEIVEEYEKQYGFMDCTGEQILQRCVVLDE